MDLIQQLEQEEISRLGAKIPDFAPGDTVIVNVNVVEGTRKRAQAYEGVVISRRNRGLNSNFIVPAKPERFSRCSRHVQMTLSSGTPPLSAQSLSAL